jgi:hypothetical protein
MTGPLIPVGILNPIRAVVGIPDHRFNLFVKCSSLAAPEADHHSGPALVLLVAPAEEEVVVRAQRDVGHGVLTSQRAGSFQIGVDDLDQIVGPRGPLLRPERGRTQMAADMVLDDLRHKPVDRAAHRGDDLQHIGAGNLGLKRALDGVDLPKNPPDASQELRFFPDRMRHERLFVLG